MLDMDTGEHVSESVGRNRSCSRSTYHCGWIAWDLSKVLIFVAFPDECTNDSRGGLLLCSRGLQTVTVHLDWCQFRFPISLFIDSSGYGLRGWMDDVAPTIYLRHQLSLAGKMLTMRNAVECLDDWTTSYGILSTPDWRNFWYISTNFMNIKRFQMLKESTKGPTED